MIHLGVVADCFALPPKEAMARAAEIGFRAAQLDATAGDLDPAGLSRTGRRHVVRHAAGLGLSLAALGGVFRRGDLSDPKGLDERIDKLTRIMELARDIGAPAITVRAGAAAGGRERAIEALRHLAARADVTGTVVAVEAAGVTPATVAEMLREVDSPLVCACYDPAEVAIHGGDAIREMEALGDRIAVAHVRDAVAGHEGRPGHETPFGQGQIDFREYFAMLEQGGRAAIPLLRRTDSQRPSEELAAAKSYMESLFST